MIKAEIEGSELLLLAAGCSAFEMGGAALGADEAGDLLDAGPSITPAPLLGFFFFVMLWYRSLAERRLLCYFCKRGLEILDSFRDRAAGRLALE